MRQAFLARIVATIVPWVPPHVEVGKYTGLLVAIFVVAGCSHEADRGCDRYAEMEARCELSPSETPRGRQLAMMVCSDAQAEAHDWLSKLQAQQVQCAQASGTCDVYQDCKFQIALP